MAIEENQKNTRRFIPSMALTVPYMAAMVLIYVGERLFPEPMSTRLLLDGLGIAGILWAILGRTFNRARALDDSRSVQGMILLGYLGGLAALLLYALQLDPVREALLPWLEGDETLKKVRVVLQVLWPIVWLSAILPVVFMETSFASMARAPQVERRRVAFSAASGLTVAWVVATLFLVNYLANENNKKWDLSYMQATSPSEDAERLVAGLVEPMEVVLFYPDVNEVREELVSYFEELAEHSDRLRIRAFDLDMEPRMAEELGVRKNGTLVYRYGKKKETNPIGLEIEAARSKLQKLDEEFQKKFLKLVVEDRVAYFVTGHGERRYDWSSEKDHRPAMKRLKSILRAQNFEVKPLGLAQGLATEVPEDASLLLIIDPTEDFFSEELKSLEDFLNKGGKLWVALDPDSSSNVSGLLEDYGVTFVGMPLAHDRSHVRVSYRKSDRYNIYTNRTSSHPSVNTLSRNPSRLVVVFVKSGYLEKKTGKHSDARVVMTLRSMPLTWVDESRELKTVPKKKDEKTYNFCAAVSMPSKEQPGEEQEGDQADEAGKDEMRMLVLADADALSDFGLRSPGNHYLFDDGLKWLFEEKGVVGSVGAEEDVRIVHTKDEDVAWFYSTIFGLPLVVLAIGIVYNRFRVRRKRRG